MHQILDDLVHSETFFDKHFDIVGSHEKWVYWKIKKHDNFVQTAWMVKFYSIFCPSNSHTFDNILLGFGITSFWCMAFSCLEWQDPIHARLLLIQLSSFELECLDVGEHFQRTVSLRRKIFPLFVDEPLYNFVQIFYHLCCLLSILRCMLNKMTYFIRNSDA